MVLMAVRQTTAWSGRPLLPRRSTMTTTHRAAAPRPAAPQQQDEDSWYNQPFDDDEDFDFPPPTAASSRSSSSKAAATTGGPSTPRPSFRPTTATATTDGFAPSHFFSAKALEDVAGDRDTSPLFRSLCLGAGLERPSKIQAMAWPLLRTGQSAIVAEQTGSGKTLAYLIPLLQRMLATPATAAVKQPGTPRVVVLAPTAELADQIRTVCDKLSRNVSFKTLVITATGQHQTNIRDQIRKLQRTPVDVLISTPGRLSTILRTRNAGLDLSQVQAIVLDEVDVLLLDDTFGPQLRAVGAAAPVDQTQFVFCTATLPDAVVQTVKREFPNVQQIRGPGLHKVAPTVNERLIDVSVSTAQHRNAEFCFDVKAKHLLKALRETRCRRTLIFCNTVETCRQVENLLNRHDRKGQLYQVGAYHNALAPPARQSSLAAFGTSQKDAILVCTDRAARGVDFDGAAVDHVIVLDFPSDPADYVRRVGRTARAGRGGTSTVMAYGWQLPIARSVMGQKLQEFRAAEEKNWKPTEDEDDKEEWSRRQRNAIKKKNKKDHGIKGNIEGGRLWT